MFQTVVRATREITQGSDRARVWLGGVALAPHRPSAQKGGPEEVVSRRSEGRVFRGREWQVAEAVRSEEWAVRFDSPFAKITLPAFGKRTSGRQESESKGFTSS